MGLFWFNFILQSTEKKDKTLLQSSVLTNGDTGYNIIVR